MTYRSAEPALRCPRCGDVPLGPLEASPGVTIDFCGGCKGLWCDEGELATLLGVGDDHPVLAASRRAGTTSIRHCPACPDTFLRTCRLELAGELRLELCPTCQGEWIDGGVFPELRARVAAAPVSRRRTEPPRPAAAPSPASRIFSDRFEFDVPIVNAVAVPAALLLALLLDATGLQLFLSVFVVNMWLHELGHAALAWFSGYHAVPLPFVTFTFPDQKSGLTSFALALILGAFIYFGMTRKRPYLAVLGGVGFVIQAVLTLIVPKAVALEGITFAGCAGEMVWSTLLLVSFYYRLPDRIRWDFWRYVALFFGAFGLVHAVLQWHAISGGQSLLPSGSKGDTGGDMNKLLDLHGWTAGGLIRAYVGIGDACLAVVAVHYGVFLRRALAKARAAARG